jgi:hypothetical protein
MDAMSLVSDSGPAESRVRVFLARIAADSGLSARFLNSLSLLEYIGSRKIMVSQAGALNGETLKHLAEETRHAFFFKRAAEAVAGRPMDYGAGDVLAGPQARLYMGRLDAFIARSVSGPAAYLYMSTIVEMRAVWFYKLFDQVLKAAGRTLKLSSLLAEEQNHLAQLRARLADPLVETRLESFAAHENIQFARLLDALEDASCAAVARAPAKA